MQISINSNIDAVLGRFARLHDQFPFAVAKALTDTAKSIQRQMPEQVAHDLDKPTPFTRAGFYYLAARKASLTAEVGAKDKQAQYLHYQVEGGTRQPARVALRLPSQVQLNTYGNLPAGTIARLLAAARSGRKIKGKTAKKLGLANGSSIFYGQPRGHTNMPAGLYSRRNAQGHRSLVPLVVFPRRGAHYDARFKFYTTAQRIVDREFDAHLNAAWQRALATAR